MKLLLERNRPHLTCTTGQLFIDGAFECFTLEDVVREIRGVPVARWKIPGKTAIPAGLYNVTLTWSPRFQKNMPLINDVPGFTGVRIHCGNTDADTEGCVLVGRVEGNESILNSADAYRHLYPQLEAAIAAGELITLEIRNPPGD